MLTLGESTVGGCTAGGWMYCRWVDEMSVGLLLVGELRVSGL